MIKLITGVECYCPEYLGKRDIVIAGEKMLKITSSHEFRGNRLIDIEISGEGLLAFPGIIDQHVHITGGGGEEGASSRIPELDFEEIILAGVTTLVGLFGADGYTRSLENLLMKARALHEQGVTTFIYSGSYLVPAMTFTGSMTRDLILIDKVIGAGEIAISDHRSSQPSCDDLVKLCSDTHIGGLIGGKAGVVHFHVGDGKNGLAPLTQLLDKSDLPIEMFVPTHVNRNSNLFEEGLSYLRRGGNIDLTAGETAGISVCDAIKRLVESGIDLSRVTISSDANGSAPNGKVGRIQALYDDIRSCIVSKDIPPDTAFNFVTENVAKFLKFYPKKGALLPGSDADILIMDHGFNLDKLFCRGQLLIDNGEIINRGKNGSQEVN